MPNPIIVNVPGIGPREFPGDMPLSQIQENVRRLMQPPTTDVNEPNQPVFRDGFSADEDRAYTEQSHARSRYKVGQNPKGQYGGQLMDIGSHRVEPEDVIGLGAAIGPNIAKRGSNAIQALKESGNPFKAMGAGLASPSSEGLMSRLMAMLSGKGAGAAEDVAANAMPQAAREVPGVMNRTSTAWDLPSEAPVIGRPGTTGGIPNRRWLSRTPGNVEQHRTGSLVETLDNILGGGVQVGGTGAASPQSVSTDLASRLLQILKIRGNVPE